LDRILQGPDRDAEGNALCAALGEYWLPEPVASDVLLRANRAGESGAEVEIPRYAV